MSRKVYLRDDGDAQFVGIGYDVPHLVLCVEAAITDIIGQVQATINPNLKLLGILPTMVDNTAMSKDTRKVFEDNYGELVFPMNISRSVTAAYSSKEKKALCFKANSKLGEEYRQFADEVVRRITA